MNLGVRWSRALMLDPEARRDWELWLKERRAEYVSSITAEGQDIQIHRLQGKLQALDEIELFIAAALDNYRLEEAEQDNRPSS